MALCEKYPNMEFFSGPYFPIFRLNTEIYGVHLRTQSIYGKKTNQKKLRIWTLFTSVDVFKVVFSVEGDSI